MLRLIFCCHTFRSYQELPYHLEQLLDNNRLTRCLLEWEVFERLFSEDFSIDLLRSWQKVNEGLPQNLHILSFNVLLRFNSECFYAVRYVTNVLCCVTGWWIRYRFCSL